MIPFLNLTPATLALSGGRAPKAFTSLKVIEQAGNRAVLEVNDGTLTLSGERKSEALTDGVEYQRNERVSGKFSRSFYLPQTVKQDSIKATYRDGILEIQVPKAEEAKPRQIEISVH